MLLLSVFSLFLLCTLVDCRGRDRKQEAEDAQYDAEYDAEMAELPNLGGLFSMLGGGQPGAAGASKDGTCVYKCKNGQGRSM